MSEAIERGITRYHALFAQGTKAFIEQVSRGIYRLVELPPISNPDLVTVSQPSLSKRRHMSCLRTGPIMTSRPRFHMLFSWRGQGTHGCLRRTILPSRDTDSRMKHANPASKSICLMEYSSKSTAPRKPCLTALSSATKSKWMWYWKH